MRKTLLLSLALLAASTLAGAARPLHIHVYSRHFGAAHTRIGHYLIEHGLLTPAQAACATLVPGRLGSPRVAQLAVFENYGGRCPGAPQPRTFLFDVYVDRVSGVVDTTAGEPGQLQTVL